MKSSSTPRALNAVKLDGTHGRSSKSSAPTRYSYGQSPQAFPRRDRGGGSVRVSSSLSGLTGATTPIAIEIAGLILPS
jgi:hypothetical protein